MNFEHEYIFINNFDLDVFNNGPISNNDFLEQLQQRTTLICDILSYNNGIPSFSSFIEYDSKTYKITVNRS